jgi:UDP-N-acetylglucosamine 1-carboxyvinyltransferase
VADARPTNSIAVAVATQAAGTVLIFEKMFENRLFHRQAGFDGAGSSCATPRAVVTGRRSLRRGMASPDIRAGMAMLIAALAAEGESRIGNVGEIDRGYERIDARLRELGANIERVHA